MSEDEAFAMIRTALAAVRPELADEVRRDSDIAGEGMLDSLDVMAFLFELEQLHGRKIEAIDENFRDFTVPRLIEELVADGG
jgi:acyl carrier protein